MPDLRAVARRILPDAAVPVLKRVLPHGLRRRLSTPARWRIGIYGGPSPLDLEPLPGITNPVLTPAEVTDVPALFVADPFALQRDGVWHLLFEVYNGALERGQIASATSEDLTRWDYRGIVLDEPFHLSYPYLVEWQDHVYMVPESGQRGQVRLYRAAPFPSRWEFVDVLIEGPVHVDSSLFRHAGRWWMLSETGESGTPDTLRLYHSADLGAGWTEHPGSPVVRGDARSARPAGRVVRHNGRLLRFAQDCYPFYGARTRAFEIIELSQTSYRERALEPAVLAGSGEGWNAAAMHHLDAHRLDDGRWMAFVDGE